MGYRLHGRDLVYRGTPNTEYLFVSLGCLVSDFVLMDRDQVFARTHLLFAAFYANSCTRCST